MGNVRRRRDWERGRSGLEARAVGMGSAGRSGWGWGRGNGRTGNRRAPCWHDPAMPQLARDCIGRPAERPCSWCASPILVVHRPGRPRLYCNHACRQRAYEHRHGFTHQRTPRELPGQHPRDRWRGTGYEQGGRSMAKTRVHALRTAVRAEGYRRETLCGVLAEPLTGRHFDVHHPEACASCRAITQSTPLRFGISVSNELAQLRAMIDEVIEHRVPAALALAWMADNGPLPPPKRVSEESPPTVLERR